MSQKKIAVVAHASPFSRAVLAQGLGLFILLAMVLVWPQTAIGMLALAHGLCAMGFAMLFRLPRWWWVISLIFAPLAVLAQSSELPASVWLFAFVTMLLVFWRTDASRVPLYMSNSRSAQAVASLLPMTPCYFADLGCGDGRLLRYLARHRPDSHFVGIEHAPLTWAWAWVWGRRLSNLQVHYGSFWAHDLNRYDVVYAFLSPVPMAQLWDKACSELKPNARLVSNSFRVPEAQPVAQVQVADARQTQLWVYATPPCSG